MKPFAFCSFCNLYDEILFHMFYECDHLKCLEADLVQWFPDILILQTLTPQTATFGIFDSASNGFIF